jgi:predicted ester cyclase
MVTDDNKRLVREVMDRAFNGGDLSVIDQYHAPGGIDHQEPLGTDFLDHLKKVVVGLRRAFPDLHFEIHAMLAEGDVVAFRSTMTGTHSGVLNLGPGQPLQPTRRKVSVPHMHFVQITNGKTTDLWHLWNTTMMLQQLGAVPQGQPM